MATTTDLSVLKINYLTQAQYNTALSNNTVNSNELYLTPSATLTVAEGGTGITSNPSMLTNLASTTAANVFQASPRPGVTGILGIANGGTGLSSLTANRIYVGNGTSALKATNTTEFGTIGYSTVSPGNTSGDDAFYKAALIYLCKNFTGERFIGNFTPNSTGPAYGHVYDVADRDATTELPRYSTFIYHNLAGNLQVFGTNNYVFYRREFYDNHNPGSGPWVLKAGDTMTGQLQKASASYSWVNGRNGALVRHTATTFSANQYNPILSAKACARGRSLAATA